MASQTSTPNSSTRYAAAPHTDTTPHLLSTHVLRLLQNNLSNPPTPPASLPPTPPPVSRQKMVNGFATMEELTRKELSEQEGELQVLCWDAKVFTSADGSLFSPH